MAINVSQAFHRTSANPIDESLALTKAQMLTVNDNLMPNKYFTVCQDDGKIYLYDKTNEPDVETGRFREFEGGSIVTIDSTPTQGSANAVSSGGTYTALAGKVDAVSGKGLSTNDYTTADKDKLAGINLSNYVPTSQKGANNGVATLGSNGKIPMSQIPNGLDETIFGYRNETDGLFYEDAEFTEPINPQVGIFYYDELSTNFYRWTGTAYVSFTDGSTGLVLGEVTGTAYDGGKGKENRDAITAIKDGQSIDSFGDVETALDDKVDKVSGKGLSTNDYDNTEKTKVTNAQPKTLETAKTIEGASVTTVQGVADAVQTHTSKSVTDNNGVHGFKVTVSGGETTLYYKSGNSWEEISVGDSIQKAELPTASQDNVGMVLQYVGDTTSVAPIYKHGYFYECVEDSGSYSWQNIQLMDVRDVQKIVLPTASADELGNIYQYVGSTTQTYKKGFFYECTNDGSSYEWVAVPVQSGGGGQTIQYDTMPTASSENEDDIIQYIGETTANYTNGYYYKCVLDDGSYKWEECKVQSDPSITGVATDNIAKFNVETNDDYTLKRVYIIYDDGFRIKPFSESSYDDIAEVLRRYYITKELPVNDIRNVWEIGSSKTILISAMSATGVGESHAEQNVSLKIVDYNHDTLATEYQGKTKALLTVGFLLSENGYMNSSATTSGGWKDSARRTWSNATCYNALPTELKNMLKQVVKTTDSGGTGGQGTSVTTTDKVFIPTIKELVNSTACPIASGQSISDGQCGIGGSQYALYNTVNNRKLGRAFWTSSSSSAFWSGGAVRISKTFASVSTDGTTASLSYSTPVSSDSKGLYMHFCM